MNNSFDQMILNQRERPLSSDLNIAQSQIYRAARDVLRRRFAGRGVTGDAEAFVPKNGFIGDSFKATPTNPTSMALNLRAGLAFYDAPTDCPTNIGSPTAEGVNDLCPYKPLELAAAQLININAAPGANQVRIDLIEVRYNRVLADADVRGILDPTIQEFIGTSVDKTLQWALDGLVGAVVDPAPSVAAISYKVGTPIAYNGATLPTTAGPAVTAGYIAVCEVLVFGAGTVASSPTVAITNENIRDKRKQLFEGGSGRIVVDMAFATAVPNVAPTAVDVVEAPSGMAIAGRANDNTTGDMLVYAAMPIPTKFTVESVVVKNSRTNPPPAGGGFGYAEDSSIASSHLTTGDVTNLANAAVTTPAQTLAIGQEVLVLETFVTGLKQIAGAVSTTPIANPITLTVTFSFEY